MNGFKFPEDKKLFYSNAITDRMEQVIQHASTHFAKEGYWLKEFVSVLLEKNDVKIVEQQTPDGLGFETRIVMGGKIVTSFRSEGFTVKIWRDPEFYGISKGNNDH